MIATRKEILFNDLLYLMLMIMKVLKSEGFPTRNGLVTFINENDISKEDVLFITQGTTGFHLFYYATV